MERQNPEVRAAVGDCPQPLASYHRRNARLATMPQQAAELEGRLGTVLVASDTLSRANIRGSDGEGQVS